MQSNIFIPRTQTNAEAMPPVEPITKEKDALSFALLKIAQWAIVCFGATIVLFSTPAAYATLHFDKVLVAVLVTVLVVILVSLITLRRRYVKSIAPVSLGMLFVAAVVAVVSGLFSGDSGDALWGTVLEVHTAGFMLLTALVATLPLLLQSEKRLTKRFLQLFSLAGMVVLGVQIARIFVDVPFLTAGVLSSTTATLVGSFNDLAIFAGVMSIGALLAALVLPLSRTNVTVVSVVSVMAMLLLAIVNFSLVWYVLGLFSLVTFIYLITAPDTHNGVPRRLPIILSGVLCILSVLFIVAGQPLSDRINSITGASYVEVRPSPAATLEIARSVYETELWLGVGPNRFADAWRLNKDVSLNQTVFWDTDFMSGYGYVPTWFITTGVVGGGALVLFHLLFMVGGVRILLAKPANEQFWYFTGLFSFVSALFLIIMSYLYVPSAALLLLCAFFVGLTFASYAALRPTQTVTMPLVRTRQLGLVFMAGAIVVMLIAIYAAHSTIAAYGTASALGSKGVTAVATDTSKIALTARLQSEIVTIESLLATAASGDEAEQAFVTAATNAVALADELIAKDATDPRYYYARAKVYAYLTIVGIEGALSNAERDFAAAAALDPRNPKYALVQAQLNFEIGDLTRTREFAEAALELKPNYTDAVFVLTQVEVAEGNTESAISRAQSLITLEPNNPVRYYQLGTLYLATESPEEAIVAFDEALRRNSDFANARYLKALALVATGDDEAALTELRLVAETNPDNAELASVIAAVEAGQGASIPVRPLQLPTNVVPEAVTADDLEGGGGDLVSPTSQVPPAVMESIQGALPPVTEEDISDTVPAESE